MSPPNLRRLLRDLELDAVELFEDHFALGERSDGLLELFELLVGALVDGEDFFRPVLRAERGEELLLDAVAALHQDRLQS